MARFAIYIAAFILVSLRPAATQDMSTWFAIAEKAGGAICDISDLPRNSSGNISPVSRAHRAQLYLRCEASGGSDEFIAHLNPRSCCLHLSPGDASSMGVCPDRPGIGLVKEAFRRAISC